MRPLFAEHCAQYQDPDEGNRMADQHLDQRETFRTTASGYSVIVPGEPEQSEHFRRMASGHE